MKDNLEVKSRQDRGVPIGEDRHTMAYISYQLNHYKRLDELVERLELLEPHLVTKEQVGHPPWPKVRGPQKYTNVRQVILILDSYSDGDYI